MSERWIDPHWRMNEVGQELIHIKGHYHPNGKIIEDEDIDCTIPDAYIHELVSFLDKSGYIRPMLKEQSRDDDLNIINRLIDTMQQSIVKK